MLWNGEGLMSSRYAATKRSLAGGPVEERSPCIAVMDSEGISTLSVQETGSASTTTVVISVPLSDFMFFSRVRGAMPRLDVGVHLLRVHEDILP